MFEPGYHAPIDIMTEANKLGVSDQVSKDIPVNFCVGKEWHRFPSSFFFPSTKYVFYRCVNDFVSDKIKKNNINGFIY